MSHPVSIPTQLPGAVISRRTLVNRYETARLVKLYDTWLLLKSLTTSGHLLNYKKQVDDLAAFCKLSRSSFYNRLRDLQALQLVSRCGSTLQLASYATACEQLGIDPKQKTTVYYDPHGKATLQHIIKALEIKQNQQLQASTWLYKLQLNSDLRTELTEMLVACGCNRDRLRDPEYFRAKVHELQTRLFEAGKDDFGAETVAIIHELRADNNRSVRGMQAVYGCKSPQTISYTKRQLWKAGLITVEHLKAKADKPTFTPRHATDKWFAASKQKVWVMPDQIVVNLPGKKSVYAKN